MSNFSTAIVVIVTCLNSVEIATACSEASPVAVAGVDGRVKRAYGPEQLVGPPDAPSTGDSSLAWCPATTNAKDEWIEIEFAEAVVPERVIVYANYTPGAVAKVIGFTESDMQAQLWSGKDPHRNEGGRFVSRIKTVGAVKMRKLRIELRCDEVGSWNEIDAVGIQDGNGKVYWPVAARASSSYATGAGKVAEMPAPVEAVPPIKVAIAFPVAAPSASYAAAQATGEPNTPDAGDRPTAWASATADGQDEWLELEYAKAIEPAAIIVHENCAPGALAEVTALVDGKDPVVIWKGDDPTPRDKPRGISTVVPTVAVRTKRIRLSIKSKDVPGWNEIDAVGIRDKEGMVHWAKEATASSVWGATALEPVFAAPAPLEASPPAPPKVLSPEVEVKAAEIPADQDPFRHAELLRIKAQLGVLVKQETTLAEQLKQLQALRARLTERIEALAPEAKEDR